MDRESKSTRFAKRKKQRPKRFRSDGLVLGKEAANSSDEDLTHELGDAVNFLQWIRNPTLQNLAKLRKAVKHTDKDWMTEFLEFDGLGLLFQCLKNLSDNQGYHLSDMVLRMECIMCIREVINSQSGLDCLLKIKGRKDNIFGRRFASALEMKNLMVKMQIFELLSALCVYSKDGYYLTLDALERYRTWQKNQYRFDLLLSELRKSDLPTYKATIMALVNSIIVANENIRDRIRIRNEFIALNILDTINSLRCDDDRDLNVQCDVFEEELSADAEAVDEMKDTTVNLSDHTALFKAIYNRVENTPLSATLLGIFHALYQIDPYNNQSETLWTLIERLSQEAVGGNSDSEKLLSKCKAERTQYHDKEIQTDDSDKSVCKLQRQTIVCKGVTNVPPPPPPPPPPTPPITPLVNVIPPPPPLQISGAAPSPPPPPPPVPPTPTSSSHSGAKGHSTVSRSPLSPKCLPAASPPSPLSPGAGFYIPSPSSLKHVRSPFSPKSPTQNRPDTHFQIPNEHVTSNANLLSPVAPVPPPSPGLPFTTQPSAVPAINTPDPNCKMKTLSWNKIPQFAFSDSSVWVDVLKMKDDVNVEYKRLEEWFSQKVNDKKEEKADDKTLRRLSSNTEITLLDPKRSMNVNIFLKQLRKPNEEVIELIKKGDARAFGVEKLKGLLKILPQPDEVELIQSYEGDIDKLGPAERFYHEMLQVKAFKLRLESMLLRVDFNSQIGAIRPNIQILNSVCRKLHDNPSLKSFLRLVLHAGNFINKGSSAGNAIGFRIGSLNKLVMMKSSIPRMTLLHHLVEEAERQHKDALAFVDDLLELLQKASRFTLEGLIAEFTQVKSNVQRLKSQIEHADKEVQDQCLDFMEEVEGDVGDLEEGIDRVKKLASRLAVHFCENENSFKLDEFLDTFREFCEKVKSCQQDLESRKEQEEKAEMRRKAHEEMIERRKSVPIHGADAKPEDRKIVDNLVNEIRRGQVLRRLSLRKVNPDKSTSPKPASS
ncbi:hypothetical protein ACJMK2_032234 [Sinanodonta woodiana]|uniref:Inverted formin-2 n=1 Tax=Sinanodonta woodiana TaxID=1069815 RepID=A0ABD3X551_SINWO